MIEIHELGPRIKCHFIFEKSLLLKKVILESNCTILIAQYYVVYIYCCGL